MNALQQLVTDLRERAEAICPTAQFLGGDQQGHPDADLMVRAANAITGGIAAVDLHTPNGWRLSLIQRDSPGECDGCGAPGPATGDGVREQAAGVRGALPPIGVEDLVDVQIDRGQSGDTITLCGGCVAEGLSIMLGRRHVQAGGDVADLRYASAVATGDASARADGDTSPEITPAPGFEEDLDAGRGVCPNCEGDAAVAPAPDDASPEYVCRADRGGCGATWTGVRRATT